MRPRTLEAKRLWQGTPSGRFSACVSAFGIYDMMGNVEEWVTTRKGRRFPGALMGGFWAKPWTGCRGTNDAHEPELRLLRDRLPLLQRSRHARRRRQAQEAGSMKALFFGTPEIAVAALDALHEVATVVAVVCQPDKPAGRGLASKAPPVKLRALELGLSVMQPTKIRTPDFAAWVREQQADLALVMAYGRIFPTLILDAPRRGCINLHASILPKYRGAAPITWAIVEGETRSGVSLMKMDEGMDTGPVYETREVPIGPDMNAGELALALAACAAELVRERLAAVVAGEIDAAPQDHTQATHAPMLEKEDGRVDWTKPGPRVHDHVRGMTPWPGATTSIATGKETKALKILATRRCDGEAGAPPGTVTLAHRGRIEVACGEGRVELVRAQLEGRNALGAAELVGGRTIAPGMVLGAPR